MNKCLNCGKELKRWQKKYCSRECTAVFLSAKYKGKDNPHWKGGETTLICLQCGKEFSLARNRLKYGAKFCSVGCSGKYYSGEKNNLYLHGLSKILREERAGTEYAHLRMEIFERDGFTCMMCGEQNTYLNAHHIFPFRDFPKLRLNKNNLVTLCIDCHNKTKSREYNFIPLFLDIIKRIKGD